MKSNSSLLVMLVLLLSACVPSASETKLEFKPLEISVAARLLEGFKPVLKDLKVTLESVSAFQYVGSDDQALFGAVDVFYQQNPGFCPLENGFYSSPTVNRVFLTLAAKGLEVRGFVYDLSSKPGFVFGFARGVSLKELKVKPCQTVSPPPSK